MPNRTVISVDPGIKGAIAVWYIDKDTIEFIDITAKPDVLIDKLTFIKSSTNLLGVAIEKVHAIPGGAAGSTFKFGFNYGVITAVIYSVVWEIFKIPPKEWQKYCGITIDKKLKGARRKREIKLKVAAKCKKVFPKALLYGKRGGLLDGRSDAAMIAYTLFKKYLEK